MSNIMMRSFIGTSNYTLWSVILLQWYNFLTKIMTPYYWLVNLAFCVTSSHSASTIWAILINSSTVEKLKNYRSIIHVCSIFWLPWKLIHDYYRSLQTIIAYWKQQMIELLRPLDHIMLPSIFVFLNKKVMLNHPF